MTPPTEKEKRSLPWVPVLAVASGIFLLLTLLALWHLLPEGLLLSPLLGAPTALAGLILARKQKRPLRLCLLLLSAQLLVSLFALPLALDLLTVFSSAPLPPLQSTDPGSFLF